MRISLLLALLFCVGCSAGRYNEYERDADGNLMIIGRQTMWCFGGSCKTKGMETESAIRIPDIGQIPLPSFISD